MLRLRRRRRRRAGAVGGAGPRGPRSLLGCGWAPSGRIASAVGEAGTDPVAPYRTRPSPPVERDRQQNFADGTLVSLSPDEFREHLVLASATAGLTLPELVLPEAHHVILRGMRFHYLDWGTRGQPPVLVDVGPEVRQAGSRKIAAFTSEATPLDSVEDFVDRALAFNPRRNATLLRRSLLHNLRRRPDGKWMWKYDQRHRGRVDPAAYERRRQLLWSAVAKVACPTLVVRGAESDVFHDEDAERLANALSDGRWVKVPGAGHTVQGDNPAGLLVALRELLSDVTVGARRL